MTVSAPARFLHVANGTCTTNIIEAAAIPGTSSIWADPLHEGPVPAGLTDEELLEVRTRYLAGPGGAPADPVNDMRRWRSTIASHESYEELVLWFEHDLFDQLNLIQILGWIRHRLPAGKPVSLICIGSFPNHPEFKGLGELTPDELASLFETRLRISDAQYDLAEHAWQAFREPTPQELEDLRRTDTSALPFLSAAIRRFLEEYPSTTDGLSRTERRFLQLASRGPVDLSATFPQMHDDEEVYYITDTSFSDLAETLSMPPAPLVVVTRQERADGQVQRTITLTDLGRAVLNGGRDRVAACGIDRWIGGVHLQSGASLWRWDDQHGQITKP